ncbi:MAG: pyridoxamine 5'-phosphate oxidase family protein [Candidatus Hermodarchaeota archaeon]
MNKQEVIDLLNRKRIVYFSTIDVNGEPRVRPFSIVKIEDGKTYFFTGAFKNVYKQMKSNPHVEFCMMNEEKTLRIRGKIAFEEDSQIVKKILDENEGYKELYKGRINDLKLIYIEHGEVHIFEMGKLFEKRNFFAFNL